MPRQIPLDKAGLKSLIAAAIDEASILREPDVEAALVLALNALERTSVPTSRACVTLRDETSSMAKRDG